MDSSSDWSRSRLVRTSVAVGLALLGVVLVWTAFARPSTPDPAVAGVPSEPSPSTSSPASTPSAGRPTARGDQPDLRDPVKGVVLPESDPVALSIPKIPAKAGWFSGGATPGALGPAVIAGHVTWHGAPTVFYRLGSLRRGDQVHVTPEDGRTAV